MKKIYVLTNTILGDGTSYIGVYDNKRQMFKDMKEFMSLCGVDFDDAEEVKAVLEQEWTYDVKEIDSNCEDLYVSFNTKSRNIISVSAEEPEEECYINTFASTINEKVEAFI